MVIPPELELLDELDGVEVVLSESASKIILIRRNQPENPEPPMRRLSWYQQDASLAI